MPNAWFLLIVTWTRWSCASHAFVLGWVQFAFTSAHGQCSAGGNRRKGRLCPRVSQGEAPPAGGRSAVMTSPGSNAPTEGRRYRRAVEASERKRRRRGGAKRNARPPRARTRGEGRGRGPRGNAAGALPARLGGGAGGGGCASVTRGDSGSVPS